MDSTAAGLVLLLLALFAFRALFSLWETALSESHRSRLERYAEEDGDERARVAIALLDSGDGPLFTQAGITLTSIIIGLLIGAAFVPVLTSYISFVPHAALVSLIGSLAVITLITLIVCEFLPKRIASQRAELILMRYAGFLTALTTLTAPFIAILSKLAATVLLLLGINPDRKDAVTEDEVKDLIEQGTEEGTFEKAEQAMVGRIFRMSDQTAYAIMTPRTKMVWLDLADPLVKNLRIIRENPQEVFPVARESLDDFSGLLYSRDLLLAALDSSDIHLEDFVKKPLYVPRSMETFRVLGKFRDSGVHEAIVLDEYGGVIGSITMDDLMREIIGESESHDSADEDTPQFTQVSRGVWSVDGLCSIDDFKNRFSIEELPDEAHDHYQTMGGFLTSYFGYIPKKGETREWNGFIFVVDRMDRARIDRIIVKRNKKPQLAPQAN